MRNIVDNEPALTIRNLSALPAGTGCRYLLAIEGMSPGEYVAKRWLRKMPATTDRLEVIIRF